MLKIVAFIFFTAFPLITAAVSCKDQNNNDVDWFVSYKMPIIHDNSLSGIGEGHAFYYMDVNMDSFMPSLNDMTSNKQAIAYTLQQYYDNKSSGNSTFVLYNDEIAEEFQDFLSQKIDNMQIFDVIKEGHTKGVVYFEKSGGFWLVHSIPKFPSPNSYFYPKNAERFGQSILCMTFDYDELTKIGTQLYYNHPQMYASHLAPAMAGDNPDLAKVIGGGFKISSPFSSTLTLQTRGGQKFLSFAKSANFSGDLYDFLVAPTLQTSIFVETWRDGKHSLYTPLDCQAKYLVLDAITMKVEHTAAFNYTKDHSKLVVSTDSSKPYVCIGDINRMLSQNVRGGGTVCILLKKLWDNYKPMFVVEKSC